ncbi:hypothetical protein, partial [Streptacidiphilus pinicola]|uniref:hypothetical protein n=1 Tax=Streptacidiphilus pinicola TaxID=2219663 RepID=UPI001A9E1719
MAASLRRRSLLSAGLLGALTTLTACGGSASSSTRSGSRTRPTPVDPDTAARQRITASMRTLLAGYDNAATPRGDLRRGLAAQAGALGLSAAAATASPSPWLLSTS